MRKQKEGLIVKKKPNIINIVTGTVFLILFFLTYKFYMNKWTDNRNLIVQFITIAELFVALINFLPKKHKEKSEKAEKKTYKKQNIFSILFVVIAVPLTVFAGMYLMDNKNYYLISLLIISELLIPFLLSFEKKKPTARELVIISVVCAIAVASRIVFAAIPQFKPVVAIIIISGICFGAEKGFLIGAITAFVSNIYFSQGPWTPWQMLAFGAMGLLSGIIFHKGWIAKNKISISVFGGVATIVIYGGLVNLSSVFLYQPNPTLSGIISTYAMGFPFDLIHAVSTAFFLWFIAEPMIEKLERIKTKYDILK